MELVEGTLKGLASAASHLKKPRSDVSRATLLPGSLPHWLRFPEGVGLKPAAVNGSDVFYGLRNMPKAGARAKAQGSHGAVPSGSMASDQQKGEGLGLAGAHRIPLQERKATERRSSKAGEGVLPALRLRGKFLGFVFFRAWW